MNKEEIDQRFKKVSDSVESMSADQEKEISSKVAAIRDKAAKKLTGIL